MIRWNPSDLEKILGSHFITHESVKPNKFYEIRFAYQQIKYFLQILPVQQIVKLNADANESDQACPAIELSIRSDRIRTTFNPNDKDFGTIFFEFSSGKPTIEKSQLRLVIEKHKPDQVYIWPVINNSDWN